MSIFQERLIKLKKERQVLQKEIAENLSISLRAYQDYEKGNADHFWNRTCIVCGGLAVCQTGQRTALDTVDFYDDRKYSSGSERP